MFGGRVVKRSPAPRMIMRSRSTDPGCHLRISTLPGFPPMPTAGAPVSPVTGFPTKRAAFLSRYRAHPQYGNRSAAGRVAAELAPLADLQAGTGRTYIAEELRKLTATAGPRPAEEGR